MTGITTTSDISPENDDDMKPSDVMTLTCGGLFWQGSEPAKEVPGIFTRAQAQESKDEGHRMSRSLVSTFRKWQKSQTHETIAVQIHIDHSDALRKAIAALGGKIL